MTYLVRISFSIVDILLLNLAIIYGLSFSIELDIGGANSAYLIVFSNLAWLFLVLVSLPYQFNNQWSVNYLLKNQISFLFIHLLVVAGLVFFLDKSYTLTQLVTTYCFFIGAFFGYRLIFLYFRKILAKGNSRSVFAIVGRNEIGYQKRRYYMVNKHYGYRFAGFVEQNENSLDFVRIQEYCAKHDVRILFFCLPAVQQRQLDQLVTFSLDSLIQVKICLDDNSPKENVAFHTNEVTGTREMNILSIDKISNRALKRTFDLVFSFAVIVLIFSWLFPIVAFLIKVSSSGPIFFIQQRNGEGNRPFGCIKFRTMVVNKEADTKHVTKGDSRITPIGNFLRKSSIDELPQFLNVFIGDMSVIGPRPHMIKINEEFSRVIERFSSRHYVKPGITGLAQCMGYRGGDSLEHMVGRTRLDRYYIENWSFWLDIKIVFLTVVSLLRGSDNAH